MRYSGLGFLNTNGSSEVYWRTLKGAVLGSAGKSGAGIAGYNQLRTQINLTVDNESKQSFVVMAEKGQLA